MSDSYFALHTLPRLNTHTHTQTESLESVRNPGKLSLPVDWRCAQRGFHVSVMAGEQLCVATYEDSMVYIWTFYYNLQ